MMMCGGVEVELQASLISALHVGELSPSRPGRFIPGERASVNNWVRCWAPLSQSEGSLDERTRLPLQGIESHPSVSHPEA
jgi:hypothetical protein